MRYIPSFPNRESEKNLAINFPKLGEEEVFWAFGRGADEWAMGREGGGHAHSRSIIIWSNEFELLCARGLLFCLNH